MIELNDLLEFNNIKIYQNKNWFSFSLDSVLLANLIGIPLRTKKILDICTGNAPIPLILSTRTHALIDAIEIQKDIYELAINSVKYNKLENQINIINEDALEYYQRCRNDYYDIITCNPPYFKINDQSIKNNDIHKTIARHEYAIKFEDVFKIAKKLLKNNGTFGIVQRTSRLIETIELYKKYNIEPKKVRFIYSHNDDNADLFIMEGTKNGKPGLLVLPSIIVHNQDGTYTESIKKYFKGSD